MVTNNESKTRECPYCKEDILADAIKCKHCGSSVPPEKPPHGGTCPYCKEKIKDDALKCKHCKSNLADDADCGCGELKGVVSPADRIPDSVTPMSSSFIRGFGASFGFSGGGLFADESPTSCCCPIYTFDCRGGGRGLGGLCRIVRIDNVCISCPSGTKCDCSGDGPYCV